jgi:hypothetical protein
VEGILAFAERILPRAAATCGESDPKNEGLVEQTGASWNRVALWLRQLESLRRYEVPSQRF